MNNAGTFYSAFMRSAGLFLACLPFIACSNLFEGKPHAEKGVVQFHEQFNSRKFSDIYGNAHDDFKNSISKVKFLEFASAVHRKLGTVVKTENAGWRGNSHNLTAYVVLQQSTKFKDGTGDEVFTFIIKDNKALLAGYNINSNELIIR